MHNLRKSIIGCSEFGPSESGPGESIHGESVRNSSESKQWWPIVGLLIIGTGLRFYAIGTKTVWLDEAFSIWLANQPLVDLWAWLLKIDQHPPLYYTLLHGWQHMFGDLQGNVRAFSALCSALTLPFFYAAGRYLLDRPTALIATLILAISPFHIRYAQETRMYALLTLLVAIALYLLAQLLTGAQCNKTGAHAKAQKCKKNPLFALRAVRPGVNPFHRLSGRPIGWIALGITQAAIMLTHNIATVFFPLALNLAIGGWLLWRRWHGRALDLDAFEQTGFLRRWLRTQLLALLLWLPWSVPFLIQAAGVDRAFWIMPPTWTTVRETWHTFHLAFQPTVPVPWWAVDLIFGLFFLLGVWRLRGNGALLGLLLALCLLPISGALLVSLRRPIFLSHVLIWVTLPYYLFLAAGMQQLYAWLRGRPFQTRRVNLANGALIFLLTAVIALNGQALHNYYTNFEKEAWDAAATHVAQNATADDLLLFNASWVQLPFVYYLRHTERYSDLAGNLHGLPVDLFDQGVLEPKMTVEDIPRLDDLLTGHTRVWLVYSHDWYTDPQGIIPQELKKRRRLVANHRFTGLLIMEFVE